MVSDPISLVERRTRLRAEMLPGQFHPGLVLAVDEDELLCIQYRHVLHAADRHEQATAGARQQGVGEVVGRGGQIGRLARDFLLAVETLFHVPKITIPHSI